MQHKLQVITYSTDTISETKVTKRRALSPHSANENPVL